MRYLFTAWPFVGHINPFMSVAKALQARGHEVAFYTSGRVRTLLEAEGMTVFPYRRLDDEAIWKVLELEESRSKLGWWSPVLLIRAFRDWMVGTVPAQVDDIREIVEEWDPALVLTETAMWGPILVLGETLLVPVAILTTFMGCIIPGPDAAPPCPGMAPPRDGPSRLMAKLISKAVDGLASGMRRRLNRIRADHGLRPMGGSVRAQMANLPLFLVPSLPELDYGRHDLPPSVHYVGPCIWNKPSHAPSPPWLDELPTDVPWVHVTEGTAHFHDPIVLRAAARGLAGLPMQAILTTGPQRDPAALDLGPIAPNVRVEQWVSHSDLLPRCSALVTTGGAGTIMTALELGVPLVVVPNNWDKPDNARRVVEAGVGLRIAPARCDARTLRAAVERVLTEPSFRENARRIARLLGENPGPDRAATLLEALAASRAEALNHSF